MPNSHFVVGNRYHVMAYKNINTEEMYHAAGMILKMSLVSIHFDELKTYLNAINKIYNSCDQAIDLKTIDQTGPMYISCMVASYKFEQLFIQRM